MVRRFLIGFGGRADCFRVSQGLASHLLVAAYDEQLPGTGLKETAALAIKLYWAQYALNLVWTPVRLRLSKSSREFD